MHYTIYAVDGIGYERAKFNGRVIEAGAEIVFLLLLVLVAKGYTVKSILTVFVKVWYNLFLSTGDQGPIASGLGN